MKWTFQNRTLNKIKNRNLKEIKIRTLKTIKNRILNGNSKPKFKMRGTSPLARWPALANVLGKDDSPGNYVYVMANVLEGEGGGVNHIQDKCSSIATWCRHHVTIRDRTRSLNPWSESAPGAAASIKWAPAWPTKIGGTLEIEM